MTLREKNLIVKIIYEKWAYFNRSRYKRDIRQWLKELLEEVEVGSLEPLTKRDHQEILAIVERKILLRLKQEEVAAEVKKLADYIFCLDLSEAPGNYFSGSYGLEMWIQANDDLEGNPNGQPGATIVVSADGVKLNYGDCDNSNDVFFRRNRSQLTPLSEKKTIKNSIKRILVGYFSSLTQQI